VFELISRNYDEEVEPLIRTIVPAKDVKQVYEFFSQKFFKLFTSKEV
jgi:hypothetical protein